MSTPVGKPMAELQKMSTTDYTKFAMAVKTQVNDVMSAGYEAAEEKKERGRQLWDLSQMSAVLRLQCFKMRNGNLTPEQTSALKPPIPDLRARDGTRVTKEYIQTTLIETKDHLLSLYKENQRLKLVIKSMGAKATPIPEETDSVIGPAQNLWNDPTEIGKILGELDLDDEELAF